MGQIGCDVNHIKKLLKIPHFCHLCPKLEVLQKVESTRTGTKGEKRKE